MSQDNSKKPDLLTTLKNTKLLLLEHKFLFGLIVTVLVLLIILLFTQIDIIFYPLVVILDVIAFPTIFAAVFYYLMKPVRDWLETKGLNRMTSVIICFLILIAVLAIMIFSLIPFIRDQTASFIADFPDYWQSLVASINDFFVRYDMSEYQLQFNEFIANMVNTFISSIRESLSQASDFISSAIGSVISIAIGIVTMPILLYYMLKEGQKLKPAALRFFPIKSRPTFANFLHDINRQLELYIRGQVLVALGVGIMFLIGYSIIGMPYGIILALLAGVLNVIPYLGSFLAMVPAIIIGLVHSPLMLLNVLIVFTIEQTIEGRILSPKVLGTNLEIHPITILVVLLVSGRLFGFVGVVIGVPLYAILKVCVKYFLNFISKYTDLYNEKES